MEKIKKENLIFIVEDDTIYREIIKNELHENGYKNIQIFSSGQECIDNLYQIPEVVLLDYNLEGRINGHEALRKIKANNPDIQVVMLSGQEKLEVAITSLKYGAFDYVIKNDVAINRVGKTVNRIVKWNEIIEENKRMKKAKTHAFVVIGVVLSAIITFSMIYPKFF